jgi:predicted transcriptional regulator
VKPEYITTKFNDDGKEYIFTARKIIAFMLITETHISKTKIGKLLNVTRVQAYKLRDNIKGELEYHLDTKKPLASVEKLLKCYEEYKVWAEITETEVKFKGEK